MSLDSVVAIAWDVLKFVVVPIKRQFGYVISSKSYAQDLQTEVGKLEYEVGMLRDRVEEAPNNCRDVRPYVTQLLTNAEEALGEARDLLVDFDKATKTCCYGRLPEPCCRYQFSRKAKAKIESIRRLTQDCSPLKDKDIASSRPAPGRVAATAPASSEGKAVAPLTNATAFASGASTSINLKDDDIFKSRELIVQEITAALADNSNSVVGIHGMGGVGKSTLLVDAEKRIKIEKSFDWIAKADVSENPDIKRIQGEIADALGLSDIKDKETISGRAKLLRERLEDEERAKKKVLIILDNLWERLDLKSVGIPCGYNNKVIGCKLLLTSRFQDLLRREMGCDRDFLLGVLQEDEAKILLQRTVGKKVHEDPFNSLVDEALNKCAGFPFLIIAMANIFKDAHFPEWRDVLRQIEMSTNKGISGTINEMLWLTYDRLKGEEGEEAKSLLRLCVVYGVSNPSIENLVRYGVGSRLFREGSSMEEVRDRLSSLIRTLKASSLLLADDEDVDGFKIHDLVRGFVATVASRDDPLLVLKNNAKGEIELLNDKFKSCKAMCFPYVDIKELPEELDCPEMRIFLLFSNDKSLEVPDSYFNFMRSLMVLHLSRVHLTRSLSPFQSLKNLYTLCLDGCSLEDVAVIGELKGLHILSFENSKIEQLPKEIGQLVELRLLDLNHCSQLKTIDPGVLGCLINLEELYMKNSFDRWNATGQTPTNNAGLIELNNMENLCTLYASIPDPSMLPEDLNVEKLTKYKIRIGHVWRWSGSQGSRTLEFKLDLTTSILQKGYIQTLLGKTDYLYFDGLNEIEQSICALSQEGLPKLKHLHVERSPSVHYVLRQQVSFPSLESLTMGGLPNLEDIFAKESAQELSNLQFIKVYSCKSLSTVINSTSLVKLPKLQTLTVKCCHSVQEIFCVDKLGFDVNVETLNELNTICIYELPSLRCIWSKHLCGFLNMHNLKELKVDSCDNLEFLFFPSMVPSLAQLRELKVRNCEKMEAIIMEEEGSGTETSETLAFSMLTKITIENMKSLMCFSSKKCSLEARSENRIKSCSTALFNQEVSFPSLESLTMYELPNLEDIFAKESPQELSNLQFLEVYSCKSLSTVINSTSLVKLPKLQTLTVKCCHSVQEIFCVDKLGFDVNVETLNELNNIYIDKLPSLRGIWSKDPCGFLKFHNLKELKVDSYENLEFLFFPSMVPSLAQLRELKVRNCEKMEAIIMEEEGSGTETSETLVFSMLTKLTIENMKSLRCFSSKKCSLEARSENRIKSCSTALFNQEIAFPGLETLDIFGLDKIEILWDNQVAAESFHKLKSLSVDSCEKLVNIIPCILGRLRSLESLKVRSCGSLEVVLERQPLSPPNGDPVALIPLKKLELVELPELKCVWDKEFHSRVKFQCLHSVTVFECKSLSALFPTSVVVQLTHLHTFDVSCCDELSKMFTPTIAGNLVELTTLRIRDCKMLTEVICDGRGEEGFVVAFNQLKYMELDGLTKLRCFSSIKCTLKFPLLEDVIVSRCPNMKFFSEGLIEAL